MKLLRRFLLPLLSLIALLLIAKLFFSSSRVSPLWTDQLRFPIGFTSIPFLSTINRLQHPVKTTPADKIIKELPGQAVLDLPLDLYEQRRAQQVINRGKKALDGFIQSSTDTDLTRSFISRYQLHDYLCDKNVSAKPFDFTATNRRRELLFDVLKFNNIHGIVLHKDSNLLYTDCQASHAQIQALLTDQKIIDNTDGKPAKYFHENTGAPYVLESFFFPQAGTLYLNGILIYPSKIDSPKIMINGTELTAKYGWKTNKDGLIITPTDKLVVPITAGTTLTIYSPTPVFQTTYLTVWYAFVADKNSKPQKPLLEQIYDDATSTVYRLN